MKETHVMFVDHMKIISRTMNIGALHKTLYV
jgi:hypothetical protein